MRKANREVKDRAGIVSIIEASEVCRIGMYAAGEVYIVPMNFGYDMAEDGTLTLYFHCANEGRKLDMIAQNPNVCFEMDTNHQYIPSKDEKACGASAIFASIIGNGFIEILIDHDERIHALTQLMKHYSKDDHFEFGEKALAATTVLKLTATNYTGKKSER